MASDQRLESRTFSRFIVVLSLALSGALLEPAIAATAKLSAADRAWINTCIVQRKQSNARLTTLRKYCVCMHDVVENNQPFGITELERTYPPVHDLCSAKYRDR